MVWDALNGRSHDHPPRIGSANVVCDALPMSRSLRIEFAGALYHVTARRNAAGVSPFLCEEDRLDHLNVLGGKRAIGLRNQRTRPPPAIRMTGDGEEQTQGAEDGGKQKPARSALVHRCLQETHTVHAEALHSLLTLNFQTCAIAHPCSRTACCAEMADGDLVADDGARHSRAGAWRSQRLCQ